MGEEDEKERFKGAVRLREGKSFVRVKERNWKKKMGAFQWRDRPCSEEESEEYIWDLGVRVFKGFWAKRAQHAFSVFYL